MKNWKTNGDDRFFSSSTVRCNCIAVHTQLQFSSTNAHQCVSHCSIIMNSFLLYAALQPFFCYITLHWQWHFRMTHAHFFFHSLPLNIEALNRACCTNYCVGTTQCRRRAWMKQKKNAKTRFFFVARVGVRCSWEYNETKFVTPNNNIYSGAVRLTDNRT